jgi:TPR repeat protein
MFSNSRSLIQCSVTPITNSIENLIMKTRTIIYSIALLVGALNCNSIGQLSNVLPNLFSSTEKTKWVTELDENNRAAESGDPRAQGLKAYYKFYGYQPPASVDDALRLAEKSASQDNPFGNCVVARIQRMKGNQFSEYALKAFAGLDNLSRNGDKEAKVLLAGLFSDGIGTAPDKNQARILLEEASNLGSPEAKNQLSVYLYQGIGGAKDTNRSQELLKESADLGFPQALNNLGTCYKNGYGVPKDAAKAVEYFKKASDLGYACAQCDLANCYADGFGVEQNSEKAKELYQKSADQGYNDAKAELDNIKKAEYRANRNMHVQESSRVSSAQNVNGNNHQTANLVNQNSQSTSQWSERYAKIKDLADKGDPDSLAIVAYWMRTGSIAGGIVEAEKLAKASADKNSPYGQFELGRIYEKLKKEGSTELFNKCIPVLLQRADEGDPEAQLRISKAYQVGYSGLPVDMRKSYEIVLKAAQDHNLMEAQENLAYLYEDGGGMQRFPEDAHKVYLVAANSGYPRAQLALGNGVNGLNINNDERRYWMKKAAESGCPEAICLIARDETDPRKKAEMFKKSADAGYPFAMIKTGECYEEGKGFDKDLEQAKKYYEMYEQTGVTDNISTVQSFKARYASIQDDIKRTSDRKNSVAEKIQELISSNGYGPDQAVQYYNDKNYDSFTPELQWLWPNKNNLLAWISSNSREQGGEYHFFIRIQRLGNDLSQFDNRIGFYSADGEKSIGGYGSDLASDIVSIYPKYKEWERKTKDANITDAFSKNITPKYLFSWDGTKSSLYSDGNYHPPGVPYIVGGAGQQSQRILSGDDIDDIYFVLSKYDAMVSSLKSLINDSINSQRKKANQINSLLN